MKLGSANFTRSFDSAVLSAFVGHEISVSVTGDEELSLSLIITEGFGSLALSAAIYNLCVEHNGKLCSVNGATQVRAGALRPELIIPLSGASTCSEATEMPFELQIGSELRIIREPHFGAFGRVIALPPAPIEIATAAHVRVLHLRLQNGQEVIVPRANVEAVA